MTIIVPRTCTWIDKGLQPRSFTLKDYRDSPAYVLLSEPGMGKTQAFKQESDQQEESVYVTARDLITLGIKAEWQGKILFIDGLDEIRAGVQDVRSPFDSIRSYLDKLDCPRFRLSCREADWLGSSDEEQLKKVAPDNEAIRELHLDELTEEDINTILIENYKEEVNSPTDFIEESKNRGLFELIKNPQILDMLVSAITDNEHWPDSRRNTFELACRRILIIEHNKEHGDAQRNQAHAIDKQLEAAGFLCSLILLSDRSGISLTASAATEGFPFINDLDYDDFLLLNIVSKTKLFSTNNDRFTYIHRTVAEYLSAYYLKKQIEKEGLPIARVLALMTGTDSIAVTALRGLFAWLVTLCEKERTLLIRWDPLGLVLYGDVKSFSINDKSKILDALKEEASRYPYFRTGNWIEYPFGALCTADMEPVFRKMLGSSDRSEEHQALVDCLLDAMMHGENLLGLFDPLEEIIRDSNWRAGIRRQALRVLIHLIAGKRDDQQLIKLLIDIKNSEIQDQDDDLLGELLVELYPNVITPIEIFDYLHAPKKSNYIGRYERFWSYYLEKQSLDGDLFQLLEELVSRHAKLINILNEIPYQSMIGGLLKKGLEIHGDIISVQELSDWLSLGLGEHNYPFLNSENDIKQIRDWIGDHPEYQKAVIELHLDECIKSDEFDWCMHQVKERFYHADLPKDYGLWCLNKAKQSDKDIVSKHLFREAMAALWWSKGDQGISLDIFEQAIEEFAKFKPWYEGLRFCPIDRGDREFKQKISKRREKEERQKQEYIQFVKDHIDDIRAGTADPGILHNLGMAYFGHFVVFPGETPGERLMNYFADEYLVQSILTGFQKCLEREDIQEVQDILQLNMQNKRYHLSFPIRAGLEEIDSKRVLQLPEDKIRKALAFYFADGLGNDTRWYVELLKECPELVAEVLLEYGLTAIRAGKEHISGIWALAFDEKYCSIARYASITLLDGFPARCTTKQLGSLNYLLKAALLHAHPGQLQALIKKKLNLRSMNVAQRAYWIGTAFLLSPSKYESSLIEFFDKKTQRIKYLSGYFTDRSDQLSLINDLSETALALLIRLFATYYPPHNWGEGGGHVTTAMNISDLINSMINKLSMVSSDSATKQIIALVKEEKLSQWHQTLQGALYRQQANKREIDFSHPDINQVSRTLNHHTPANIADLAALVFDHISDLANQVQDGDTIGYKEFWNTNAHNQPVGRRHEDACRDTFLSHLKERLNSLGVEVIKEGYYADNKRADIRVSYGGIGGFNVPIEIKCNDHKNLWYAIHDQLIAKYTRDPGAHGYGIYLVFWFGSEGTIPPAEGARPKTAKELEARLIETLTSKEERQQISVCVIDCSKPTIQ